MLVKSGANVNIKDTEGNTAENLAHIAGHQGVYEYLKQSNQTQKKSKTTKLPSGSRIEFSSDEESQSDFTKVSNQAPIPRGASPKKNNLESKPDSDSDVSWKSSNSESTESQSEDDESEKINSNRASLKPTQVDFRKIMNRFNSNFSEEFQEFGASQELKDTSEWDSSASFQPSVEEKVEASSPLKEAASEAISVKADSSKWDDSSLSSSQQSSAAPKSNQNNNPSSNQNVKSEESIEKLKTFYSKTGASEEAIRHGLSLPVSAAPGSVHGSIPEVSVKEEDESKWDTSENVSKVISDNPEPVVNVTDVSQWDSEDSDSELPPPPAKPPTPVIVESSLPKQVTETAEEVSNWDSEPIEAKQDSKSNQESSLEVSIPKNRPRKLYSLIYLYSATIRITPLHFLTFLRFFASNYQSQREFMNI